MITDSSTASRLEKYFTCSLMASLIFGFETILSRIISSEFSSMAMLTKAFERMSGELEVTGSGSPASALSAFLPG